VGNFDRTPLRQSSGVTGAGPIFHAVMLAAERRLHGPSSSSFPRDPIAEPPPTTTRREICALSGGVANAWCPIRRHEWTAAETAGLPCAWHHLSDGRLVTFWPPEYRQWARTHGLDLEMPPAPAADRVLPPGGHGERTAQAQGALAIVSPPPDATYLIDPTLRREFQTLPLRATAAAGGSVEWSVGGRVVGSADATRTFEWPLVPGRHRIVVRDQQGRTAETSVTVR
jgi:penicillin-binding protein 1C